MFVKAPYNPNHSTILCFQLLLQQTVLWYDLRLLMEQELCICHRCSQPQTLSLLHKQSHCPELSGSLFQVRKSQLKGKMRKLNMVITTYFLFHAETRFTVHDLLFHSTIKLSNFSTEYFTAEVYYICDTHQLLSSFQTETQKVNFDQENFNICLGQDTALWNTWQASLTRQALPK